MNFSSIKAKLLVLLFASIACSFLILGFYNTTNKFESEFNLVKYDQLSMTKQTSKFIDDYLKSKMQIVESVATLIQDEEFTNKNKVLVDKILLGKKSGDFASMYVGIEESGDLIKFDGSLKSIATMNYDARKRPWYVKSKKIDGKGVTDPFISASSNKLVITLFAPFKKDGKLVGVVGANIFLDTIVKEILTLDMGVPTISYLLSEDGKFLVHKDKKLLKKVSEISKKIKLNKNEDFIEVNMNNIDTLVSYSKVPFSSWALVVQIEKDSIFHDIKADIYKEIFLYLVLLVLILSLLYFMLIKLLSPIKILENGLNDFFSYLKGEKDNVSMLNIKTNDEFGNMAKKIDIEIDSVKVSIEKDKELIEDVKSVVNKIKDGTLNVKVEKKTTNKSLNELRDILNEMIETISENVNSDINDILKSLEEYSNFNFVNNVPNADGKISKGLNNLCEMINKMLQENYRLGQVLEENARNLLDNVDTLNTSSNQTAASLEESSASLEEITATIVETTQNISQMAENSNILKNSIANGQSLAKNTVESMNEINDQTNAIAEAITVIDQIAFQTNILSLNAAVEAATAGEAGKGFAVVAQEVRNLASRSAEAAKEIKDLVENATNKTEIGKKNADEMINGYIILNENINKTSELISQIESASKEQREGIEQINDTVSKLDTRTQENANVASHTKQISIDTSNIAKNIIENLSDKQFKKD
ncbi:methyl-accepting chemotaxis protein [Arcobacter arenosus]|uniref:Methyl-accepting chemotaxis protein n=1 Tax=Arcobacter arenosus TaxID=2576037 RepID=A0A5R8XZ50_9BACT|nr:methyl-accepting chemotaxis protein [Arcobacter arenosus]TLP37052.1 methyl-accepting chemotaxis protein [Arcobacter arenosus]